jgi:hypothetical protein
MPSFPGLPGSSVVQPALCSLGVGDSVYVFGVAPTGQGAGNAIDDTNVVSETLLAGVASGSVALVLPRGGAPPMVTLDLAFSGAPGAFELDIQEADVNCDADFILPSNSAYAVIAVNASSQRARVDLSPTGGKFLRVYLKTLTNAVNVKVKISRLA